MCRRRTGLCSWVGLTSGWTGLCSWFRLNSGWTGLCSSRIGDIGCRIWLYGGWVGLLRSKESLLNQRIAQLSTQSHQRSGVRFILQRLNDSRHVYLERNQKDLCVTVFGLCRLKCLVLNIPILFIVLLQLSINNPATNDTPSIQLSLKN